jgi:hypothetical protein
MLAWPHGCEIICFMVNNRMIILTIKYMVYTQNMRFSARIHENKGSVSEIPT